jgi:hypothetical protein
MGAAEIVRTIVQEFPLALYGSMLVGVICAFLGVYIVARRVVFLGAVMTQVSVMGIALTFLPFFPLPHTVGSLDGKEGSAGCGTRRGVRDVDRGADSHHAKVTEG